MSDAVTVAVIAGIPAVLSGGFTYWQSRQAQRRSEELQRRSEVLESKKAEKDALSEFRAFYETLMAQLDKQVTALRDELEKEQASVSLLRARTFQLEETLALFKRRMIAAGLDPEPEGA